MADVQIWLVHWLRHAAPPVAAFMRTAWGWPIMESVHFIGLSMLVGCIGLFDLRLLGVGKRIPIAAAHKLIPWGLAGFAINVMSGSTFLLTEPDQYIYNPSFQFKVLFIMLAGVGLNAALNWVFIYGHLGAPALGLTGAGISTLLSRGLGALVIFLWLRRDPAVRAAWPKKWFGDYSRARFWAMLSISFCWLAVKVSRRPNSLSQALALSARLTSYSPLKMRLRVVT